MIYLRDAFQRWRKYRLRKQAVSDENFILDESLGIRRRKYDSYDAYIEHQAEKLKLAGPEIAQSDPEYEAIVRSRYAEFEDWPGKRVICLGARLGGEVRAFKALGALSVGVDVEPGPKNTHVLYGDFHKVEFPSAVFDIAFTNAVDHVLDLDAFTSEVERLLIDGGKFYVELGHVSPGSYEVLDLQNTDPIVERLRDDFRLEFSQRIKNTTSYVDWEGTLLCLLKR